MDNTLGIILIAIISFLVGAIPTGVIISKSVFGFDIRTKGSGNMGSTNVMRVLGTKWGIVVQIIDILKGYLPVYLLTTFLAPEIISGSYVLENAIVLRLILGFSAVLGHVFSPFVKFKGGKGINTATGMLIAISPFDIGVAFVTFWLVVFSSGYISLGSLSAGTILPISLLLRYNLLNHEVNNYIIMLVFFVLVTILIFSTHKSNITRLLSGQENKFEKLHLFKFGANSK